MSRFFVPTLVVGGLALGLASDAQAYLDPGTGSVVLQAVIAAIAAGAVTARQWWWRVKSFFTRKDAAEKPDELDE